MSREWWADGPRTDPDERVADLAQREEGRAVEDLLEDNGIAAHFIASEAGADMRELLTGPARDAHVLLDKLRDEIFPQWIETEQSARVQERAIYLVEAARENAILDRAEV